MRNKLDLIWFDMVTSSKGNISALLALCAGNSPVTCEFPAQRPVTRSFVFIDMRLSKRLDKQHRRRWFETPSRSLWRYCNGEWISTTSNSMIYTHWGRHKMVAILQAIFSKAYAWMKMIKFRLKFHWNLFPGVQLTISQHWFKEWLVVE